MSVTKNLLNPISQGVLCAALLWSLPARAQFAGEPAASQGETALETKIKTLTDTLDQTRSELNESRSEIRELRASLDLVLKKLGEQETARSVPAPPPASAPVTTEGETDKNAAKITQDDWEILNARVEEQRQIKVESKSKFPLKLSGLALFTAFGNSGQVDNVDLPSIAIPPFPGASGGSTGASMRQSIIELTGFGPKFMGATSIADLQMDFFGGLPSGYGSAGSGVGRLRLARIRFDWEHTSVTGGVDTPFFSPNSPTTYMSVAVPGLASAGNQWAWTPSIHGEQRFDTRAGVLKVEAGFLDPPSEPNLNENVRYPSPGEASRNPAYALRFSANNRSEERPASIGVSGIYAPQRFYNGYKLAGWGSGLDWKFPLLRRTEISGEFFAGKGIDGFGGVAYSYLTPPSNYQYNYVSAPALADVGLLGGWAQWKVKVTARGEVNVAGGYGGRNSNDLRQAAAISPFLATVPARNQMLFVNYIFRPRSDLLFSAEYKRLRTYQADGPAATAGQFGLAAGFIF